MTRELQTQFEESVASWLRDYCSDYTLLAKAQIKKGVKDNYTLLYQVKFKVPMQSVVKTVSVNELQQLMFELNGTHIFIHHRIEEIYL